MDVLTTKGYTLMGGSNKGEQYRVSLNNGDSFVVNGDIKMATYDTNGPIHYCEVKNLEPGQRLVSATWALSSIFNTRYDRSKNLFNLIAGPKKSINVKSYMTEHLIATPLMKKKGYGKIPKDELIRFGVMLQSYNEQSVVDDYRRNLDLYGISQTTYEVVSSMINDLMDTDSSEYVYSSIKYFSDIVKVISIIMIGFTSNHEFEYRNIFDWNKEIQPEDINKVTTELVMIIKLNAGIFSHPISRFLFYFMMNICGLTDTDYFIRRSKNGVKIVEILGMRNVSKFVSVIGLYDPWGWRDSFIYKSPYTNYANIIVQSMAFINENNKPISIPFVPAVYSVEKVDTPEAENPNFNQDDLINIMPTIAVESDVPSRSINIGNKTANNVVEGFWAII